MTKILWNRLEHNGVYFPPLYIPLPSNIKLFYQGQPVSLSPIEEEPAYIYAKYIDSEYVSSKLFNKNFFASWKKILGKDHIIKIWENIDFSQIHQYIKTLREEKQNLSKEEKERIKQIKDVEMEKYKTCLVDNEKQSVSNFIVEPPDIFKGRGTHPKSGVLKKRIMPEDVMINISKDVKQPIPNVGGNWGNVIEDKTVLWIACWKDVISNKIKYVFLGQDSTQRMMNDQKKFDLAKKLKKKIKFIRETYNRDLTSPDLKVRQIATAMFLIDTLALRVGGEKGEDQAETVGVTSLKVKHVTINDDCLLHLDFLGKDCIRYVKKIRVNDAVCTNIREFIYMKDKNDDLFDKTNSLELNKYLQDLMPGLSAKVFRTFNASYLFQKELDKINAEKLSLNQIIDLYNSANVKVAELCNHQKKASKNFKEQIEKINNQIKKISKKKKRGPKDKQKIKELKSKKKLKSEMKTLSLGTSKINYIDPRITVAFFKKHDIDLKKVYTETLLKKFKWALETSPEFRF